MEVQFWLNVPDKLACYVMGFDGFDGCHVAFMAMEHAIGESGLRLNGAIVQIVESFYLTIQTRLQGISTTSIMAILLGKLFLSWIGQQ